MLPFVKMMPPSKSSSAASSSATFSSARAAGDVRDRKSEQRRRLGRAENLEAVAEEQDAVGIEPLQRFGDAADGARERLRCVETRVAGLDVDARVDVEFDLVHGHAVVF